jgi:hypothetical protein
MPATGPRTIVDERQDKNDFVDDRLSFGAFGYYHKIQMTYSSFFGLLVLTILFFRSNGYIDCLMISSIEATSHHCSNLGVQTPHKTIFLFVI